MIQASELRHGIELQSPTYAPASNGQRVPTWTTYASPRAKIEPLSGRELERARGFGAEVNHRITIRYEPNVSAKHRVKVGSRILHINAAINTEEKNVELVLFCTEVLQ